MVNTDDPSAYRDADVLRLLHHDRGMPTSEIAERYGVSQSTVGRHMRRNGVERMGHRADDRYAPPRGVVVPDGSPVVCRVCGRIHGDPAVQAECERRASREAAEGAEWPC